MGERLSLTIHSLNTPHGGGWAQGWQPGVTNSIQVSHMELSPFSLKVYSGGKLEEGATHKSSPLLREGTFQWGVTIHLFFLV